ncbi:MAG TPA: methyltransferase domain-containing protein [Pyrinomonadaceae bacterium]|jgi:ubiquinone/menaquinone biosynthesis C-methylase UbiE|nr:methyltransferase domain-containing protein [Pyrinomonadaceae bacterium]
MKETYKNYFGAKTAAERYAKGRPRFHSFVISKIKKFLAPRKSLGLALDVGCGTGLSSVALKEISEKIVGIDVSIEMLNQAKKADGIEYLLASAENLPFDAAKFDLLTISQAIHWVDKEKFFAEADRVLKKDSMIAAYDNYFQGQMLGNPAFNDWYKNEFLENYPVPPRGKRAFERASENAQDFVLKHEEFNENTLEFSAEELVNYLVTISNVIARVENGSQPIEEVHEWLTVSIKPFFDETRKKFPFINPIWYLHRNL